MTRTCDLPRTHSLSGTAESDACDMYASLSYESSQAFTDPTPALHMQSSTRQPIRFERKE